MFEGFPKLWVMRAGIAVVPASRYMASRPATSERTEKRIEKKLEGRKPGGPPQTPIIRNIGIRTASKKM